MVVQLQQFPSFVAPFVDEERQLSPAARAFLEALWKRTGSAQGVLSTEVQSDAVAAGNAAADANSAALVAQGAATGAQGTADMALGLAATSLQSGDAVGGWADPTGGGSRATFDMNFTTVVSVGYVQAEVVALRDQLVVVQKRVGQLILDLKSLGGIT